MFVLLGEFALIGGISTDLFNTANKWLNKLPGGLAIASVSGCAGFAAVCGDSLATALAMASVGIPAMKEQKYNLSFGAASLSIGGTLGILIPPSMGFVMYSIVTEESVARLFMAGVVPGILLTFVICATIVLRVKINPSLAPGSPSFTWAERIRSLWGVLPMVALFIIIMGGILTGVCTPTEGGAVGSFACLLYCYARRRMNLKSLMHALRATATLSGKIFVILVGVTIVGYLLASTRLPMVLTDLIVGSGLGKYAVLALIVLLYTILGMLMNVIPMILLVLPSLFPSVLALGFDPIWFGVITVLLMELGQITPPVGILVFAMSSVVPEVSMMSIFRHVAPYFLAIYLCVLILIFFPQIALWLPNLLI
jgi:tripartite ATP-independent transporter DctM subunit